MSLQMGPQMLAAAKLFPELLEVDWEKELDGLDMQAVNEHVYLGVEYCELVISLFGAPWVWVADEGEGYEVRMGVVDEHVFGEINDAVRLIINWLKAALAVRREVGDE